LNVIGIFGVFNDDPQAPALLSDMFKRVGRRGLHEAKDGVGAALGRTAHRLESCGGRAISDDGGVSVVVAGEIFNPDLFGTENETAAAILLNLYMNGELTRLSEANGQFCAAIYDASNHRLTLITDRFCTWPIHLFRRGGETIFATQLFTLTGHLSVPRRANRETLPQLLTMQRTIGRITPIDGVEALPAACILRIDRDGVDETRYWELAWRNPDFTESEGGRLLAQALRDAVARQTKEGRVGLLLSGGLDSRLVLSAALPDRRPLCFTTATFEGSPELNLARQLAEMIGAEHRPQIQPPAQTLDILDETVVASGGQFPASNMVSSWLHPVAEACDVALTGHALDYTIRGYYLPNKFLDIAGSHTRMPTLRRIPKRPTGAYVLDNLRQGVPLSTLKRIVRRDQQSNWWNGQAEQMQQVLAPWLESEEPYNAWDAFILHAVSKHYAFTTMMAVRGVLDLRLPAYDNAVIDIYLKMPPSWRARGRMTQLALRELSRDAAHLTNANTSLPADLHPWLEFAGVMAKGAAHKLGLKHKVPIPGHGHSRGSWADSGALYQTDEAHRQRFREISSRLDGLALGWLDVDATAACIDDHLAGRASHTKLLRQLLTHDSWVRSFGIDTTT
jgi:asparagine synthetase B (glutamine-hydrolysing)